MGALLANSFAKSKLCVVGLVLSFVPLFPRYGRLGSSWMPSWGAGLTVVGCTSLPGGAGSVFEGVMGFSVLEGGPRWVVRGEVATAGCPVACVFSFSLALSAFSTFGLATLCYLRPFFFFVTASTSKGGAAGGWPSPFKKITHWCCRCHCVVDTCRSLHSPYNQRPQLPRQLPLLLHLP